MNEFAQLISWSSHAEPRMVFQHIEKLKQEYTDKYVSIAHMVPELKRFEGRTGIVRTVNMSGRALVEFLGTNDISWYDIDIDFLKIVDRTPEPVAGTKPSKEPKAKAAKKSASGTSTADILAMARGKKPAEKSPKKQSTADILAAARGEKKPVQEKPAADNKPSTADILAMARGKTATPKDDQDEKSLSTAEKLAMLRGEKKADKPNDAAKKKKPTTADILAMARGKKPADEKKEEPVLQDEKVLSTAEKLALLRGEKQAKPTPSDSAAKDETPKKPSTADILAMARAQKKKDDSLSSESDTDSSSDSPES